MKEIVADPGLVAYCGLYCGACGRYLKGKCPACRDNDRAGWCAVRSCCKEHDYVSCADCATVADPKQCAKFHNPFSRIIGFVLRSDRPACIAQIKRLGLEGHAKDRAGAKRQTIRPGSKTR